MSFPNEPPSGPPLGFPSCKRCPYLRTGPPALCLACASGTFELVGAGACPTCSQVLADGRCPNWLCADPDRTIERIRAIAYSSGALRSRILRYKNGGRWGWSIIFGRLLVAWLDRNARDDPPDLVIANPTYSSSGSPRLGHTERVIDAAATEDALGEWPFDVNDPPALVKIAPTERSARNTAPAKRAAAAQLREVLVIPDRARVDGRHLLVYDDVCTTGSQLNAVAQCLVDDGGARSVEAVVLARAPWRFRLQGR